MMVHAFAMKNGEVSVGNVTDPTKAMMKYTLKIEIAHQGPSAFHELIPKSRRPPSADDEEGGSNTFGFAAPEIANAGDEGGEAKQ